MSIDPPDCKPAPATLATHVAVDETESIYEWMVEGLTDDNLPDSDDEETDSSTPALELYVYERHFNQLSVASYPLQHFPFYSNHLADVYDKPHAPPPRWV